MSDLEEELALNKDTAERESYYKAKIIKLMPEDYDLPESILEYTDFKPVVRIKIAAVIEQIKNGATWEVLSANYLVSVDSLKKVLSPIYVKARSEFEQNLMNALLKSAIEGGNPLLLKFLGSSVLKLQEKTSAVLVKEEEPIDLTSIDSKITKLLNKHNKK
jgi:hypothetical protein